MAVLVNAALGALAGVIGGFLASSLAGSNLGLPIGLLAGLVGYFIGGALTPAKRSHVVAPPSEWEEQDKAKKAKKAKKAAAEARKRDEAIAAAEAEAAAKAAAKKAAEKAKKGAKKAPVVVESESEEDEPVVEESSAPKSKSAQKKAAKKAKEALIKKEAEAAAKAAAKKAAKKEAKAPAAAAAPAPAAAPKALTNAEKKAAAAAAALAADLDGWETIEATKPTKSQLAKAAIVSPVSTGKKGESIPSSERMLTEDIIIPVKHHALIIGTKGATLNLLTAGSGATIDMPKRESASAKIQITGTVAQVHAAKNAIQSLVDRGFSSLTNPGILSDDISVEPTNIGLILGANGATLRTIQTKTGARINLPEKGSSSKKVTIVGEKEAVRAAKAALRSLITDGFSPLTHEGWTKLEMDFPAEKFGILIGPKGQTIKSIQGNTKTRINLPEKNSKSSTISVCGLPAGVTQAEKEILRLLEPLAPLPSPEEEDLATDDAWGQEHTASGEDALWA